MYDFGYVALLRTNYILSNILWLTKMNSFDVLYYSDVVLVVYVLSFNSNVFTFSFYI